MNRDWMLEASCRDHDWDIFFPGEKDHAGQAQAKTICRTCPVQIECAQLADRLGVTHGVWAGRFYNRNTAVYPMERVHGTNSTYRWHHRTKTPVCEPCRQAHNRAKRDGGTP